MTGPRTLARRLWRQITWRLFASYVVVGLVTVAAVGFVSGLFASHFLNQVLVRELHNRLPNVEQQFQRDLFQGLLIAALVAVMASVSVSLFVSHRIVGPLHQIMDASRRIADGNYGERVPIRDDFEVTQLAASFNRMAEALEQTEQRRQALIADVAHELRTPLTSIKGYMEALMDEVMPPDHETYTLIYKEADRLYRLVQDLQELSRLEAGQMPLDPHPLSIDDLIRSVVGRVRPQFEAKSVRLTHSTAPEAGYLLGDADRLCQVLLNLLSNALQYSPVGAMVQIAAYNERDQVCVAVKDSGIGIAPEHYGQIFSRFYRVDKSRSRLGGGTGIGLTIAKHLVEAHGGTIHVASTPGLGSTFTIALPALSQPIGAAQVIEVLSGQYS